MKKLILIILLLSSAANAEELCNKNASIKSNDKLIVSNVWNQQDHNLSVCINKDGWRWNMQSIGDLPQTYPSIIYGWKPWASQSTTKRLPVRVKDVDFVVSAFSQTKAKGRYNTAIDIWITSSEKPNQNNIATEVMIWQNSSDMSPAGSNEGKIVIDGVAFEVWREKMNNWDYIALVHVKEVDAANYNIKNILGALSKEGFIDDNNFVASIEYGNEIIGGKGQSKININIK